MILKEVDYSFNWKLTVPRNSQMLQKDDCLAISQTPVDFKFYLVVSTSDYVFYIG